MKRLFALVLALLMLCGCAAEVPEPTAPETAPSEAPTEEIIISYDTVEPLEFDYEDVFAAAPMGDDLLLFSGMDQTTLIKVSGRNHRRLASFSTETAVYPGGPGVKIGESGVCFAAEKEYVFLNEDLEEVERVTLPDAWGQGVVTADLQTIFYSTGSELRAYSRQTGLDRLLRETMHTGLALESLELNDSVLVCQLFDYHAVTPTLFFSAATGELLKTYEDSISLTSADDLWLAKTSDGHRNQIVFGGAVESRVLTDWENFSDVTLVRDGVLIKTAVENTAAIRFLNLANNTETVLALDQDAFVTNAWHADGILWIALDDGRLLRWDLKKAETLDAICCVAPYFSRENPDAEGLAALEPVIQDLEDTHGVKIHIVEDAMAVQPADSTLVCEYQVDTLTAALSELGLALDRFTPAFLASVGKASDDGKIHISLVRGVEGDGCIQFWDEDGIARIVLAADDQLQFHFFHGLEHIIDARVMSECGAFDSWKSLNPKGFSYLHDDSADADTDAFSDAFADLQGMISPVEDRASVFAHAMLADGESVFESETMQKKLSTLCSGIRKAFKLKDADEAFPWEQYLAE